MPYKDKEKQKKHQREWMRKRRWEYFHDKYCAWCYSTDNLVLHHLDPSKKESHCIWSWKKERRDLELEKCIVLCEKCHIHHHAEQMRKPLVHGTKNAYSEKGCRCKVCRESQRIAMAEYRKRKKEEVIKQQ